MTVAELIELLKTQPQDETVYIENAGLGEDEVRLTKDMVGFAYIDDGVGEFFGFWT